jgi:hypothetical protein
LWFAAGGVALLGLVVSLSYIIEFLALAAGLATLVGGYVFLERRGYFEEEILNAGISVAAALLVYKMFAGLLLAAGLTTALLIGGVVVLVGVPVILQLVYVYVFTQE